MITPGIYQHYKGSRYEVIGLGLLEATEESRVIYRSLADGPRGPKGQMWVRTLEKFEEEVEVNGEKTPRFKRIN